jgi:hypothetical protein
MFVRVCFGGSQPDYASPDRLLCLHIAVFCRLVFDAINALAEQVSTGSAALDQLKVLLDVLVVALQSRQTVPMSMPQPYLAMG